MLITNDDGIAAPGLRALVAELVKADVVDVGGSLVPASAFVSTHLAIQMGGDSMETKQALGCMDTDACLAVPMGSLDHQVTLLARLHAFPCSQTTLAVNSHQAPAANRT